MSRAEDRAIYGVLLSCRRNCSDDIVRKIKVKTIDGKVDAFKTLKDSFSAENSCRRMRSEVSKTAR